jgi:hypothetical protein
MVKRVHLYNNVFLDLDKVNTAFIKSTNELIDNTDRVRLVFEVHLITDLGQDILAFRDIESGANHKCIEWITKNWLK